MRRVYKILAVKHQGRHHFEYLGVNWKKIFKNSSSDDGVWTCGLNSLPQNRDQRRALCEHDNDFSVP
jgi:hypothetical protein